MLTVIHAPACHPVSGKKVIRLHADRRKIAKRLWRGVAEDGREFGFELEAPLQDGDVVFQDEHARYVIAQEPEPVLEVPLDVHADAAATIGWQIGNMHLPVAIEETRLLLADDPAARKLLDRLGVHYHAAMEVFRCGRHAADFHGHGHGHHHEHGDHGHGHGHQH